MSAKAGYSSDCRGSNHLLCQSSGARCTCVCHGCTAPRATPRPAKAPKPPRVKAPAHVPLAAITPPPVTGKSDIEEERVRILATIAEHGPIRLDDLAGLLGRVTGPPLHWHVLVLGDRGLVVWEDRHTCPKVRAA